MVEFSDRLELLPVGWVRDCIGLGRFKACDVGFEPHEKDFADWKRIMGDGDIFVVVNWKVYDDESDETDELDHVIFCGSKTTLEDAQKVFQALVGYLESKPKDRGTDAGVQNFIKHLRTVAPSGVRWITHGSAGKPNPPPEPEAIIHDFFGQKSTETKEVYQARLKVLAGVQPHTVALIWKADQAKNEIERRKIESQAVEAYFAEVAMYWTPDIFKAWQRNNPVGPEWYREFVRLLAAPERQLDAINHELALNWLRRGYKLLTHREISEAIYQAMNIRVLPDTIKHKSANLGLTGRPPGPRPKSARQ